MKADLTDVVDFESVTGRGVRAYVNGILYLAGNRSLLDETHLVPDEDLIAEAEKLAKQAKTIIWFANEHRVLALAAITDRMKVSSKDAVKELESMGIEVHMLTGDNEETARCIATQAGIRRFKSGVLPAQKADYVKQLQAKGRCVAMVGDGINDSAALAQSDLGIAMGQGSDIAMDVAKMTIISSDLLKVPSAIRLSIQTVRTIRQNLFWAFVYNMIGVPIAAGVLYPLNGFLLNPMIAGAAMAMSSVSVVTNSLRLSGKKLKEHLIQTQNIGKMKKKEYLIGGMMCNHCRMHVEKALNALPGITAVVTLEPPVAVVEYSEKELPLVELKKALDEAGGYTIEEK